MKVFAILMITTLLGAYMSLVTAAEEHRHDHGYSTEKLSLNQGEKWQIDESLHIGMSGIKKEMMANLDAIHHDKYAKEQYSALAKRIDAQISYLFEHCKLPAKADAQLHILLANIMQGSHLMKAGETPRQGAIKIIQSLNDYPQYFNDSAWQAFEH